MRQIFNFFAFVACGVFNVTQIWSNISFFPFKNRLNDTFRMHWHNLFTFSLKVWEYFTTFAALCILLYVYCYIHFLILQTKMSFSLDLYIDTDPLKYPPVPPLPVYKQKIKNWSRYPQFDSFQRCWSLCSSYGEHIHNCIKSTLRLETLYFTEFCILQLFAVYLVLKYPLFTSNVNNKYSINLVYSEIYLTSNICLLFSY